MKKILFVTLVCIWSVVSMYAWDRNILISTKNTSLLFAAQNDGDLRFAYYGDKITPDQINQIHDIWAGLNRPAYPTFGSEYSSATALQVVHPDGNMTLDLIVKDVAIKNVENGEQTVVTLRDKHYPFEVKMNYKAYNNSDIIEMWAEISHAEKKAVVLKRFDSGCMPIRRGDVWISHLHGSWIAESDVTSEPLKPGMKTIKNMDGARNGQGDHAEVMFSLDGRPQENTGRMIGAALCWSGNYKLRIDTDNNYSHNFLAGINDEASEYKLEPKEVFVTPKLAFTYSEEGLSGVSRNFHRWARNGQIHGGNKLRDILLNSWEGVYFDIDEQKMDQMMGDFAAMGGELFVMDDGWFGDKYPRNNDHSSLGDWVVNKRKLPNGVDGLIATAKKHGIKFGIWIEPESANTVSELYEKHPDWIICQDNRTPTTGRGGTQMILDLSNPKVQDFVFGVVDNLMTNYPEIAYIKWDANASIMNYGSYYLPKDRQSHLYIEYHKGLNNVLERIRTKYPHLLMQACASGGSRVNYGLLPYFGEFWTSDNTDAYQRIYMQWGVSNFYPAIAMASHVSADKNHQTGRRTPLKFRFDVAMSGRLGMEMQPKDMTDGDKEFAKRAIKAYKEIRPIVQHGDLYRLVSPYDKVGFASLMYATPEKDKAVFFAYRMEYLLNQVTPRVRMTGLDPDKQYKLIDMTPLKENKKNFLDGKVLSGKLLLEEGVEVPFSGEYSSVVMQLIEVK